MHPVNKETRKTILENFNTHKGASAPVHRIAIIGSGPRGLSVLERLAALISNGKLVRHVDIYLIDAVQVGCGRVWRTDQPDWFMMNTVADEVSAFSGPSDDGPARPGAGPSLAQWWQSVDRDYPGPNSYAPRALHGRYMQFVLATIEAALTPHARLLKITDYVTDLHKDGSECVLSLANGFSLRVDRVILVTGHSLPALQGDHDRLASFAASRPALRYLRGDSAADMPLADLRPGEKVGVVGLGLSFYDVMATLTVGRGGRFIEREDGSMQYLPSGREPVLYAGSRSGMLIPARGRNQKDANFRYSPLIFTQARADAMRSEGQVDFHRQVTPLILAEVNLMYYATSIRRRFGHGAAAAFLDHVRKQQPTDMAGVVAAAHRCGAGDMPPLDIDRIAHPFAGASFESPDAFRATLLQALHDDVVHAEEGNMDSPLKAALDVIRDIRAIIRSIVDFGGLSPRSFKEDFLGWYVPRSSFLSAGPPRLRTRQAIALIEAGVLHLVGPRMRMSTDEERDCFVLSSPQVASSAVEVTALVDARIPIPNVDVDTARLSDNLRKKGFWTNFINSDGTDSCATGGVAVTPAPFHPIARNGLPVRELYVLGIPSEHTRWFMQAGSSRPGFWTDFVNDANAIAEHALAPAHARTAIEEKRTEAVGAA